MSDHTIVVIWVRKICLYSFSVYFCHLFLISSASVRSIPSLSFIVSFFVWNIPLVSLIFLKRSLVFYILLFSSIFFFVFITEEGFLISPCNSLELCIQMDISFLFSFAFHFSSTHIYLLGLLRQPFCLFAFIFLGNVLDLCLLYSVTNLCP